MNGIDEFIRENHIQTLRGKNNFEDEFSIKEWGAAVIQRPEHLEAYSHFSGLIGAKIEDVAIVGDIIYTLDGLKADSLYPEYQLKHTEKEVYYEPWSYEETMEILKTGKEISLFLDFIDEPIILITDQGRFEIDFSNFSSVLISQNCIPCKFYEHDEKRESTFNIKKIFSCIKNDTITGIKIKECNYELMQAQFAAYNIRISEKQPSYIEKFSLLLESGRQIQFFTFTDYGFLRLCDKEGNTLNFPALEVNDYLNYPIGTQFYIELDW